MFNFFEEVKKRAKNNRLLTDYNILLVSGRLLYVEGHCGVTIINPTLIAFRVKGTRFEVSGRGLEITELTDNTILIEGEICEVKR